MYAPVRACAGLGNRSSRRLDPTPRISWHVLARQCSLKLQGECALHSTIVVWLQLKALMEPPLDVGATILVPVGRPQNGTKGKDRDGGLHEHRGVRLVLELQQHVEACHSLQTI